MKITKSRLKEIILEELRFGTQPKTKQPTAIGVAEPLAADIPKTKEKGYDIGKITTLYMEVQDKMIELAKELEKLPEDRGYPAKRGPGVSPDADPGVIDGRMIAMYVDLVRTKQVREIGRRINKILDILLKKSK